MLDSIDRNLKNKTTHIKTIYIKLTNLEIQMKKYEMYGIFLLLYVGLRL